jgi:hypothetical protein
LNAGSHRWLPWCSTCDRGWGQHGIDALEAVRAAPLPILGVPIGAGGSGWQRLLRPRPGLSGVLMEHQVGDDVLQIDSTSLLNTRVVIDMNLHHALSIPYPTLFKELPKKKLGEAFLSSSNVM